MKHILIAPYNNKLGIILLILFALTGTALRLRVAKPSKVASLSTREAHRRLATRIRRKSRSLISRQILGQRSLESLLNLLGYRYLFFISHQFEKQRLKRGIKHQRPGLPQNNTKSRRSFIWFIPGDVDQLLKSCEGCMRVKNTRWTRQMLT